MLYQLNLTLLTEHRVFSIYRGWFGEKKLPLNTPLIGNFERPPRKDQHVKVSVGGYRLGILFAYLIPLEAPDKKLEEYL